MSKLVNRALQGKFTLIAEIGVNYYDIGAERGITPMEAAKLMIAEAKKAGIHAVKFQSYKAESLAAKNSPYYWDLNEEPTRSQYELFKKFDAFGKDEYTELSDYCDELDIEFLSTAFDITAADYLEPLMDVYKISSSDINNLPFILYQARKNKPVILSTGASCVEEIDEALRVIRSVNDQPIILMHCVLEYPTPYEHANLARIKALKERYRDLIIGYSDHTKPDPYSDVVKMAYLLGAVVIEKHFTLDKTLKGNDHYHAMNPEDASRILSGMRFLDTIRGNGEIDTKENEAGARINARRSLVTACNIKAGQVISEAMLTCKRPASGIAPSRLSSVVGKRAVCDIEGDTILLENMLE